MKSKGVLRVQPQLLNRLNHLVFYAPFWTPDDVRKFPKMVDHFYQVNQIHIKPIIPPHMMVSLSFPGLGNILDFIRKVRQIYLKANGNLINFKACLRNISSMELSLFNILVSQEGIPLEKIITFNYLDKLVAQLLLGWCKIMNKTINVVTLFKLIDGLEGAPPIKV